jgi:triosephosphate isomerase (TIM)
MGFKPEIATSAEDVSVRSGFGAYTGELSAQLLMDSGITWALTGHSERRDGFNAPVCSNHTLIFD